MDVCFSPCLLRIHWLSSCRRSPVDSHILNRKHNFKRPSSLMLMNVTAHALREGDWGGGVSCRAR